ncbi:hypothetical protein HK405_003855 [Cladochytrium tenue]|nr:hypothetical protein HK405_003855 [Cladochytrium tenue]
MAPPADSRPLTVILAEMDERAARPVIPGFSLHYPYIVLPKPRRWIRWIVWVAIFLGITLLGSIGLTKLVENSALRKQQKGSSLYISPGLTSLVDANCGDDLINCDLDALNFTGFAIVIAPLKFDTDALQLTVDFSVTPRGSLANTINILPTGYNVTFSTYGGGATYTAGAVASDFSGTFAAYTTVADYPFETYDVSMTVYAEHKVGEALDSLYEILVTMDTGNYVSGFSFEDPVMVDAADGVSAANVQLTFHRNAMTKATVVFTWIVMHAWAMMVVLITAQVAFRQRDPDPVMTWTAAAVFTIGSIRGIQPRVPAIGTVGDVVTYVWTIMVIAVASFILFIFNFRRFKPKTEKMKLLAKKEKESKWREILKFQAEIGAATDNKAAEALPDHHVGAFNPQPVTFPAASFSAASSVSSGSAPTPTVYFPSGAATQSGFVTSPVGTMPPTQLPTAILPPQRTASAAAGPAHPRYA